MIEGIEVDIKGFIESSFLDWPGQVAAVIFLAGCNFRCPFCHNHGLVLDHGAYPSLDWEVMENRLKQFRGWIDGVVVSGGEPTMSPGLTDLLVRIKKAGFKVKLDTNGSRPEILGDLIEKDLLDHVAMDVKGPLDEVSYTRAAGRPGFLKQVQKSLEILSDSTLPYTLRTTAVPQLHTEKDIISLAEQLKNAPLWILQNFKPDNALDQAYRCFEPFSQDLFEDMSLRAYRIQAGAA